jgi:hypothetical protein
MDAVHEHDLTRPAAAGPGPEISVDIYPVR